MGKILFFDIDGTLYRKECGVPVSARNAIAKCRENGHKIILCTGRNACMLPPEIEDICIDGLICGCGAYVKANDNVLTDDFVDGEGCMTAIEALREYNCPFYIENSDYFYYDPDFIPEIFKNAAIMMQTRYKENYRPLSELPGRISKITAYPEDRSILEALALKLSKWFDVIVHLEYVYIEITLKKHSKGTGVRQIAEHFGADIEDTYGFGDSNNDIGMLETVGHAMVMGDSPEELKEKYIPTDSIYADGLAKGIEYFGLI